MNKTPRLQEIWNIVQQLQMDVAKLKLSIQTVETVPLQTFDEWCKEIVITTKDLEYLFSYKYMNGVKNILKQNLAKNSPVKSKNKKKIIKYTNTWEDITKKDLSFLRTTIQIKIANVFQQWVKENQTIVNSTRSDIYYKNMIEAFGGNIKPENIIKKMYTSLHKLLI